MNTLIFGYGDIGHRIVIKLIDAGESPANIIAFGRSVKETTVAIEYRQFDLDESYQVPRSIDQAEIYYLIPPQLEGFTDERTAALISALKLHKESPRKVVLISTTGVYGDSNGDWVDEESAVNPSTPRARRRLDSEQQWQNFCEPRSIDLAILRVPGIYSFSRIPRERLAKQTPVVRPEDSGYTNRVHADDLALIATTAMRSKAGVGVFNACDGTPGTISEYLKEAAAVAGLPIPEEITLQEAEQLLSDNMLSYLKESRKISNKKMLSQLEVALRYPDFRVGLRH